MSMGHCKQCHYFMHCSNSMPYTHLYGVWNTVSEKREWMRGHAMDCFKSPQQYQRDIECAEKSRKKVMGNA